MEDICKPSARAPTLFVRELETDRIIVRTWNSVPLPAILVQLLLPPYNALHYNKEATANYAVHYMLGLFKSEGAEFEKKICASL